MGRDMYAYVYVFMNMCMIIDMTRTFLYKKHICFVFYDGGLFISHVLVISSQNLYQRFWCHVEV